VNPARRRGGLLLWTVAGSVVVLDRATKVWAEHALAAPRDLLDGVLTLRLTTNSGGAFSLGDRAPLLFAAAAIVVCAAIAVTSFRARPSAQAVALGLILGGASGNLLDRLLRGPGLSGRVIDFIDLHVWPVFNAADAAIVVGALLLALVALRDGRAPPADEAAPADDG
jgi:signal peptidase II